jgi:hypothetical protein
MTWVRIKGPTSPHTAAPAESPGNPYTVTIQQKFHPNHGITVALHDKPPTPTGGGGGWEEVPLPRRGAVLIWKGRPMMKLAFSIVFDHFADASTVIDKGFDTLLNFWRPADAIGKVEPSVLSLRSTGDLLTPYGETLDWIISNLEWANAQGDHIGQRTQQVLDLEFTEWRPDERLKTASQKGKPRTKPFKVKKGDTLANVARKYGISGKELGAMQKPPIKDPRKLQDRKTIVVPVGKTAQSRH